MSLWKRLFGAKESPNAVMAKMASTQPAVTSTPQPPSIQPTQPTSLQPTLPQAEPLHDAARDGDLEKVKALLKDNPDLVLGKNKQGATPLHRAAYWNRKDVAELLLANKAKVNAKDQRGETPLHMAASWGFKNVAELLLANKADVNAKSSSGWMPLHGAAFYGRKDVVELLMANNAEVNARTDLGSTPLHLAAAPGHQEVVKLLLASKADVNAEDSDGATPLHLATHHHKDVAELLRQHGGRLSADAIIIRCEACGTSYTLGVDAVSMTSGELARMMPGLIGRISTGSSPDLMIGRSHSLDKKQLQRDRETILRLGPKGWTCKECYKDNQWRPVPPEPRSDSGANLERWKSSGEPEAWVRKHLQGWNHNDWLEFLASLHRSQYWPMDEATIGRHLETLREQLTSAYEWGMKYYLGQGIQQDYHKAREQFRIAADQGHAKAQSMLGNMYDKGDGGPQDYKEAIKWYRLAADQRYAVAQFCVGVFYRDGFAVPKDYDESVKWIRLAAEQGYDEAQFNLGLMYLHGHGVVQSVEDAAKWWRRAADQGNGNAKANLAALVKGGYRECEGHEWTGYKCSKCGKRRDLIGMTVVVAGNSLLAPLNTASERDRSFFCVSRASYSDEAYDGFWLIDGTRGTTGSFVIEKVLEETPAWVIQKYPRVANLVKRSI